MNPGFPRVLLALFIAAVPLLTQAAEPVHPRAQLIEDAYQLLDTIEETHPDPYLNGGGKVAFHRRFHELLSAIPEEGMTTSGFMDLVQPFLAGVGDSHTAARQSSDEPVPILLPIRFTIVAQQLVVGQVAAQQQEHLLGARLAALEGVPLDELISRQGRLRGLENRYGKLVVMILRTLTTRQGLQQLIPEWPGAGAIRAKMILATGKESTVTLELLEEPPEDWITPPSQITMPSLATSDVAYTFLDPERSTALLVIANLMRYREACELWFADGLEPAEAMARAAYQHFHGSPVPEPREELLAGIPSATGTIVELVEEMRAAGTRNLIVDLRGNTGGSSVMREILVYLLFGRDAMRSLDNGYQIVKHSPLLFEQYRSYSLEEINTGRPYPLRDTDYDFREEQQYRSNEHGDRDGDPYLAGSPTFREVYETARYHDPLWAPEHLLVLSSPSTFSSGFNVLTGLRSMGGIIVGTASAQPGNRFGDMLMFRLQHSGIEVGVSYKQNVSFPDDPEVGRCLQPDHPLSYEALAVFRFDPNAEILLALEIIRHGG